MRDRANGCARVMADNLDEAHAVVKDIFPSPRDLIDGCGGEMNDPCRKVRNALAD